MSIIIDTPPKNGIDARPAIEAAHLVIVPVTLSPVDIWTTEPTEEMTRNEKKPTLLVLNRTARRSMLTRRINREREQCGCTCATTLIGKRVVFVSSMSSDRGVMETGPSGVASHEVDVLAQEIREHLDWNRKAAA